MAWRRNLLPAKYFTSTVIFGWHHLTSISRDDLNAAQDVATHSSSARNLTLSGLTRADRRRPLKLSPALLKLPKRRYIALQQVRFRVAIA